MKKQFNFFVILLIVNVNFLLAQNTSSSNPKKNYTTIHILNGEAPIIDGILDDSAWDKVVWGKDFIENEPDENTQPSEQTQFKIVYDDKYLYVGIRAFDSEPDKIVKQLSRRDGLIGDRVNFVIDSYNDKRTAFIFTVTAAGVKGDEIATDNGNNIDDSWNPIWYTKAAIDNEGWTAEMKIPFSQLRFGNNKEQIWGMSLSRNIFRHNETSLWNRVPIDAAGFVSELGILNGLIDLKAQKQIEIQPFTVTKLESYPAETGNPFRDGSDFKFNGGLDAKIGVTNDLTLDLTVNPDFGQVEADPAAINLDGFEIFFREQRPFFVENKNIFDYGFANDQDNLFFSRRIGRSPQGYPSTSFGEYVDQPINTTILGAAKFSGKTKNGWSIGVLESITSKEFAEIDTNGSRREELVEPLTNYFVGRLQKDFNNKNTYVGGIFTAVNRNLEPNLEFLRKEAYSGGLDFKHQWKDRQYFIEGNVVASHVKGSKEAIADTQSSIVHLFNRVDAGHVDIDPNRTSLTGTGGRISAGKVGGGNWSYNAGFVWRSPELELNDIGFLRQADEMRQYANINYRILKPTGTFRTISGRFQQFTTYDFEGNFNRIQYSLGGKLMFNNNYWIDVNGVHKPIIYLNTALRGGPRWRYSEENNFSASVGTDERKKLRSSFRVSHSWTNQNNFSFFYTGANITYQPTNALRISLDPSFSNNPNKTQYVTETDFNGDPRYILGTINNTTISAALRLNYTIDPNLSIQYYGQPFISRAKFTDFKHVTNPIADDLYDRFYQYNDNQISYDNGSYLVDEDIDGNTDYSISNPDFSFVQFRSNLVVRWEYIPGSELFLVWSQGVTGLVDSTDKLFSGLENGILNQKPENIFLIKATYRFVL